MFSLACTWIRGNTICGKRSPEVRSAENAGAHAMAAGWRVWKGRAGIGDDRLLPGEVLCPAHRHDPMTEREAAQAALDLNELREASLLSVAGEGEKN